MRDTPVHLNAGNRGAFTLDGTRTYLVGDDRGSFIIDPGPDVDAHIRAVASAVQGRSPLHILLTHHHPDHAGGAASLARLLDAPVLGPPGPQVDRVLADEEVVGVGGVSLKVVHTPGHTSDHLCFHEPDAGALFAGDHLLGEGDTTWVAGYPGCVADYLVSLGRLRALDPTVIYPTHGPPLERPLEAIDRFESHRRDRIHQVREALNQEPGARGDRLLDLVYGELPTSVKGAARESLEALREYVETHPHRE